MFKQYTAYNNKRYIFTFITFLFSCGLFLTSSAQAGRIKCWTNEDGMRECGSVVPPQFSQQGHEELNSQGVRIRTVKRAKTPEEIRAELAKIEMCEKKARDEKRVREKEQELLALFSNEQDIITARDARLGTVDAAITSISAYIKSLNKNLADLEKNYEAGKNNKAVSKTERQTMVTNIKNVKQRLKNTHQTLRSKKVEREGIMTDFSDYLTRLQAIKERRAKQAQEEKNAKVQRNKKIDECKIILQKKKEKENREGRGRN